LVPFQIFWKKIEKIGYGTDQYYYSGKLRTLLGINVSNNWYIMWLFKDEKPSVKKGKRQKICGDYLSYIDPMGELVALMDDSKEDEVKRERNIVRISKIDIYLLRVLMIIIIF